MKTNNEHRLENIKEKEFHDKFIQMFSEEDSTSAKAELSGITCGWDPELTGYPKEYLTEKEENICVSLIQWLGSPAGQNFLDSCGFFFLKMNRIRKFQCDGSFFLKDGEIIPDTKSFMEITETPIYSHDCTECIFLGNFYAGGTYDLYFCPSEKTIISRSGNKGPEYISGVCFAKTNPQLKLAYELAKKLKLL